MITDLNIVGGGILGLAAAIQAKQHGLTVQLFEKDPIAMGATRRNFGILGSATLSHPEDCWNSYAQQSISFYRNIQKQMQISFQGRTGLYLATNTLQAQVLNEFAQAAADYAIQAEYLNKSQVLQRYAYLNADSGLHSGLVLTGEYSVEPDQIALQLTQYAKQIGVEIYPNACVVKTSAAQGMTYLELATGECFSAQKLLICNGASTEILYPQFLQHLGVQRCHLNMAITQPFRGQLDTTIYSGLSIARYPGFAICPSYSALLAMPQDELVTHYGIHVLLKQNHLGQIIVGDSHEYTALSEPTLFEQHEQINQFIQQYCQRQLGFDLPPLLKRWQGQYLSHPEQPAFFAEVEPNIYIANAIAGKGMTTGPGWIKQQLNQHIF
ncbi:FAD-dependent oxidoreductase [Acinetobacter sp. B51(2017)]|uniref:FAD-dependent oxidoreductase n=1 Tax=Acinetobacter sp. B51(2017) TaxID=2060938 RepID=UPI000F077442|nr:FAD-dependent oxidoreductase [Acinetobacter sp. B51(2017)]